MRVRHPQEVVRHIDDDYNLIILKNCSFGLVYKRADYQLQQLIMDRIISSKKTPVFSQYGLHLQEKAFLLN